MKEATRRLPRPQGFARAPEKLPLLQARIPHVQQQEKEAAESRLKRPRENQGLPPGRAYLQPTTEGGQQEEHAPYAATLPRTPVPKAAPVTVTLAAEHKGICIDNSDGDEQQLLASNSAGNEKKRPRRDEVESTPTKKTRPSDPPPPMSLNPTESPAVAAQAHFLTDKPKSDSGFNGRMRDVARMAYAEFKSKHEELLAQQEKKMKEDFDKKAQQLALQYQDEIRDLERQVQAQQAAFRQSSIRAGKQISALKQQISTLECQNKLLTNGLGEASAKNSFLRAELRTYRDRTSNTSRVRREEGTSNEPKREMVETSVEDGNVRAQLHSNEVRGFDASQNIDTVIGEYEVSKLKQEVTDLKKAHSVAYDQVRKHKETNSHLRYQLSLANVEKGGLRDLLLETQAQPNLASAGLGKLQAQLHKAQAEFRDERIMQLEQEAVGWKNKCVLARAELQKHHEIDSKDHKPVREKQVAKVITRQAAENLDLRRRVEEAHTKNTFLRDQLQIMQGKLQQAERRLQQAETQLESFREMASSEAEKRGDKTMLLEWAKQQTETRHARSINAIARASVVSLRQLRKRAHSVPMNKDDIDDSRG